MKQTILLEPVLDLKAAAPLKAALMQRRGAPLEIDASAVQALGGLCLQVLLSAQRTWTGEGQAMTIAPRSESFAAALALFGGGEHLADPQLEGVG